jgi:hypothetical protein
MEPFAGCAPLRTRRDIALFLESFPTMTVQKVACKVAQDELQGSCASVFHLEDPPAGVPSRINSVETFRLNSSGQLVFLKMFWHPSETGGAAKTSQYEITAKRIRSFTEAMNKHPDGLPWAEEPLGIAFEDPVGTLSRSVPDATVEYLAGLPPFRASLRMVRVGQDELQAAAVVDLEFVDSNGIPPFAIIFIFEFA